MVTKVVITCLEIKKKHVHTCKVIKTYAKTNIVSTCKVIKKPKTKQKSSQNISLPPPLKKNSKKQQPKNPKQTKKQKGFSNEIRK